MFAELVALGKRIYQGHDALGYEKCSWHIAIDKEGCFLKLIPCDESIEAEKLSAKKGRARLLLDKPEETLCFEGSPDYKKKHERYINKLNEYKTLPELAPVFLFYANPQGIDKALYAFKALPPKQQEGNMTFMVDSTLIVKLDSIKHAIIKKYEDSLYTKGNKSCLCAICGTNKYPILKEPHGSVQIPKGQKSGSMLVSYNEKAFESYHLIGNLNSNICTNCARNYVEALKYLVWNGYKTINEKGQEVYRYTNRQNISDDTIVLFWTKAPDEDIDPFSDVYQPTEERMRKFFTSVVNGNSNRVNVDVDNYFYCFTLSSAAARIAVRDWMAISVAQYKKNLTQWFEDIKTKKEGKDIYPGIYTLVNNCIKKKTKQTQSDLKAKTRIGTMLWHAALTNSPLPVIILQSVMSQIEHEYFYEEKSTVIRLVINRNLKNKYKMKEVLDEQNASKAYLCGRLFALICKLQYIAQGAVNSSIKDRFFSSASNAPARVMGLLLTKYVPIYEKKTKGAYTKTITEIASRIGHFPDKFSAIERGEFALGYYYQYNDKQDDNNNN